MNETERTLLLLPIIALLSGCAARQASGSDSIPVKNVVQCHALCESAQMELQSIVIVANQTGCVCGVKNPTSGSAAGATGGAVTMLLAEERQAAQAQVNEQN